MKDTTMSEIADGKSVAEIVEGTCGRLEAEPSAQSFLRLAGKRSGLRLHHSCSTAEGHSVACQSLE